MATINSGVHVVTPSACVIAANTSTGGLSSGVYTYKVTLLTSFGESLPSVASNSITASAGTSMNLTSIPVGPDGNTIKRNIYRTIAGGSTYLLVTTLANNTATTYLDALADGSLGAAAPVVSTADSIQIVNGYVSFQQPTQMSVQNSLTALSGGANPGTLLSAGANNLTTVAVSGDSCSLPILNSNLIGLTIWVKNNGVNPSNVFPGTSQSINALSANTAFSVTNATNTKFIAVSATNWQTF